MKIRQGLYDRLDGGLFDRGIRQGYITGRLDGGLFDRGIRRGIV